jgi:cytochrome c oxidase subunit 2
MLGKVIVEDDATLREWMNSHIGGDDKLPPVELGKKQFVARSCNTCHSLDGSHSTGPSFKGVFGRKEALEGGSSVVVDENYIRESITAPAAKLVKGYPAVMPVFKGVLTDKQIDSLIAFIKAQK